MQHCNVALYILCQNYNVVNYNWKEVQKKTTSTGGLGLIVCVRQCFRVRLEIAFIYQGTVTTLTFRQEVCVPSTSLSLSLAPDWTT